MPRAFVALRLDPEAERRFADLAKLVAAREGAKAAQREDLHVTLRFLGEVDLEGVGGPVFERAVQRRADVPAMLVFDALSAFPSDAHATVIVAEATRVPDGLRDVVADLERAGAALGVAADTRTYRPHVTLARLPRGRAVAPLGSVDPVVASVRSIALCTTHVPGVLPRYEDVRALAI